MIKPIDVLAVTLDIQHKELTYQKSLICWNKWKRETTGP